MKTKQEKLARIAALFAVSNLGHFHNIDVNRYINDDSDGPRNRRSWSGNACSEVCVIAGHLMENDEHETFFGEEADGWMAQIKDMPISEIARRYHWHAEWINKIDAIPEQDKTT